MEENNATPVVDNSKNARVLHSFDDVRQLYFVYITSPVDRKRIEDAYVFAEKAHANQFRKSGEPYIHHLIEVAYILAQLQAGPNTIITGLLHDTVEDTDTTIEQIRDLWGDDVAMLVDSLTKIQRLKLSKRTDEDFEAEDHKKIFLGMAKDVRVIIVKLADRLHNMRTLDSLKPDRQQALANETLHVFAPIADRLGIYKVKSELEDLSLKYLEPDIYNKIQSMLDERTKNRQKSLDSLKKRIADIIYQAGIKFEIESRVKSIYSIYRKMYIKMRNFDDIYDIMALRVITETELNCYEILGLIHATYKPIPGRFKDYIAVPKANMYQSLHTSIMVGDGNAFEVQIRTKDMDEIAETGIAAHWRYKEGTNYDPKKEQQEIGEKLYWFRDFMTLSKEDDSTNANEYMENLSKDVFGANVYVFTPKGKVIDLPTGSTPIDFAYRIHTKVGDQAIGAVVNGTLVPLNTQLKTADIVEIKTSQNSPGPSEGWLKFVKTSGAVSAIKRFLQKKNSVFLKDEKIAKGKQSAIDAFKDRGVDETEMMSLLSTNNVLNNYHCETVDDLFIAFSNHNPLPSNVIEFLHIQNRKPKVILVKKKKPIDSCPVYVNGNAGDVAITLAKCCTPIPGDDIVGYITKGKGIVVHRRNCPNIIHEKQRLIDVFWKEDLGVAVYPVDIRILCSDRQNLIVDVMNTLSAHKVSISEINAKYFSSTLTTEITVTIFITDSKNLNDIFGYLSGITSVIEVTRVIH